MPALSVEDCAWLGALKVALTVPAAAALKMARLENPITVPQICANFAWGLRRRKGISSLPVNRYR
jgi:hypothetical protein